MYKTIARRTLAFIIIFSIYSSVVFSKSPVWKVSKNEHYFYLGGTIHLLAKSDYPLPDGFDFAFSEADELFFETDIQSMNSPQTQLKLIPIFTFGDSRTLKGELSPNVYSQLESFLAARKIPIANFDKFTPAGISLTLMIMELQRLGVVGPDGTSYGVDEHYSKRAIAAGKKTGALESVDEQVHFLMSLNDEDSDQIIRSSLSDMANMETVWKRMLEAWADGDLEVLEELGIEPMQQFPRLFQLLLVDRNNNWLEKIIPMMETPEIEFILVGALHMVGEKGLIHQLQAEGYTVENLN